LGMVLHARSCAEPAGGGPLSPFFLLFFILIIALGVENHLLKRRTVVNPNV